MRTRAERRHHRERRIAYAKRCIRQNESALFARAPESEAQTHRRAAKWSVHMDVHGSHCMCKLAKQRQIPTISEQRKRDALLASA